MEGRPRSRADLPYVSGSSRIEAVGATRTALLIAVVVASLALMFGEGLVAHARFAADRWNFNDDVRQQIWPLLRDTDSDLFRDDFVADYYLANVPPGYRLLYRSSAPLLDPRTLSKVLPYLELLVVLYAVIATAWKLGGPAAGWGAGALCLSADLFLGRMCGGLPRSFGFPVLALTALALVRGKATRLFLLTLLGTAFYYPVGILIGLVTAIHLLLMPRAWQGDSRSWSLGRRVAVLSATAAAAGLLVVPEIIATRAFGPLLSAGDVAAYPEAGPDGRYGGFDLPQRGVFLQTVKESAGAALLAHGPPWDPDRHERGRKAILKRSLGTQIAVLLAAGFASLLVAEVEARRLLALLAAPCILYPLALLLWPRVYIPARYVTYVVPLFVVVALPAGFASLARRLPLLRSSAAAVAAVVVAATVAILLFLGGRGPGHAGISVTISDEERPLYHFVAGLPPDATIAGWPGGPIENVPYLCGRKILLSYEVHQAFHKAYVEEMRRRMEALIDAYFADDLAPLRRLRSEFGVTHLLVRRADYGRERPSYFAPFERRIADVIGASHGASLTLRLATSAAVFEHGQFIVLDLDRIALPEDPARGEPPNS